MMNVKTSLGLLLPTLAIFVAAPMQVARADEPMTLTAEVTPKLYFFDFTKGWADGDATNHYFQQYNYLESLTSAEDNGFIFDADVDVMLSDDKRVITLQREGYGIRNHRNKATIDESRIGGEAHYSRFASGSYGLDYMAEGYQVESCDDSGNCTFLPFSALDDSAPGTAYVSRRVANYVERTTRGVSLTLKPALLADWLSVKVGLDGYDRTGNEFWHWKQTKEGIPLSSTTYRSTASNFIIDETANTFTVGLASSLKGLADIAYDFSVEKFDNKSHENERPLLPAATAWLYTDEYSSLDGVTHFIPDTTLLTHAFRLNKQFGDRIALAAGYSRSHLDQDSMPIISGEEQSLPINGIQTTNAFVSADYRFLDNVSVEAHGKRSMRDNEMGYLNASDVFIPYTRVVEGVDTQEYGLSGTYRAKIWNSSATLGWNHFRRQRDFVEYDESANILYRDETRNNEVYLKLAARPLKGLSIQLIPSFVDALEAPSVLVRKELTSATTGTIPAEYWDLSKVAYPTDPESAFNFKARVNYAAPNGMSIGAYYDRKHSWNSDLTMSPDSTNALYADQIVSQRVDRTLQSAGATFAYMPTDKINTAAQLFWTQTDGENYYLVSRPDYSHFEWDGGMGIFDLLGQTIDVYGISLAADWKQSEKLTLRGNYSYTQAEGEIAKSLDLGDFDPGAAIDQGIHSLTFGADFAFSPSAMLKSYYTYEYYNDKVYPALEGGLHTVMVGVSLKF